MNANTATMKAMIEAVDGPKRSKSTMKTYSVRENGVWAMLIKAPSIEQAMAGAIEMAEPAHFDSHDYEAGTVIEIEVTNEADPDDSLQRTITIEAPEPVPDASKLVDPNTYYNVETPVPGQTIGNVYLNTQDLDYAIQIATRLRLHVPEEIVIRLNSGGYVEGWEPKGDEPEAEEVSESFDALLEAVGELEAIAAALHQEGAIVASRRVRAVEADIRTINVDLQIALGRINPDE